MKSFRIRSIFNEINNDDRRFNSWLKVFFGRIDGTENDPEWTVVLNTHRVDRCYKHSFFKFLREILGDRDWDSMNRDSEMKFLVEKTTWCNPWRRVFFSSLIKTTINRARGIYHCRSRNRLEQPACLPPTSAILNAAQCTLEVAAIIEILERSAIFLIIFFSCRWRPW